MINIKENELLSKHTSLHIGGAADFYVEANSISEIREALDFAHKKALKVAILGGGSNSLFTDSGFRGLVLRPLLTKIEFLPSKKNQKEESVLVRAEAGVLSIALARKTAEKGITGFEWAVTLPGTVGGAVRGNAGCFGGEIKDTLVNVELLRDGELITLPHSMCDFAYRESTFKKNNNDDVILAATFQFKMDNKDACQARIEQIIAKRKATQPQGTASAGCMFKNYEVKNPETIKKLITTKNVPQDFIAKKMIPAGWLIEQAELKGFCIGGACVSDVHGNFLVTKPGTTADHVLQLVAAIKTRVRDQLGVQLEEEVSLILE